MNRQQNESKRSKQQSEKTNQTKIPETFINNNMQKLTHER